VVGAGIGGLAAAVALHRRGADVVVFERFSTTKHGSGVALSLWPNALRALDELGVGDLVRARSALGGDSGVRRRDGSWLARSQLGSAIRERFGDPLVIVRRALLVDALEAQLPRGTVRSGRTVHTVTHGSATVSATVHCDDHASDSADVVVGADGIRSAVRSAVFPDAAVPRYAGYTAWRMIVPTTSADSFETWGGEGERFAVLPLGDGHAYCYATAALPARTRFPSEVDELRRRFGRWHEPVASIVASLSPFSPSDVIRSDVEELPALASMARQRVALVGDAAHAMTPDLGQGGCQALEDAVELAHHLDGAADIIGALRAYSQARLPRTTAIARRSHQAGRLYQRSGTVQHVAARLMGAMPASWIVRGLDAVVDWRPASAAHRDAGGADSDR
jgi:2-polyprenyl-6-methoxyphenol hydroxylase-like FAD-dependent oxidoreductase